MLGTSTGNSTPYGPPTGRLAARVLSTGTSPDTTVR
jgi:hypothetical protein